MGRRQEYPFSVLLSLLIVFGSGKGKKPVCACIGELITRVKQNQGGKE